MKKNQQQSNRDISEFVQPAFFLLILLFNLNFYSAISQQNSEIGLPLVQNYSPVEYGAFDQNWNVAQDSLGILYFANGYGVLTYNGAAWDLLKLPNNATIFVLTTTTEGQIYAGGTDELGYLEPNDKGQLAYISLLPKLPKKYHDFHQIRSLCSTKDGLFFASGKYIFRWDGKKFKIWENPGDSNLFTINNRVFNWSLDKGLMELKNNQFELVPQSEKLANSRVKAVLPFKEKDLLIATEEQLYIYNGLTFKEFTTDTPDFFKQKNLYTGVMLNNGTYAFGSRKNGILIINDDGHKEVLLTKNENLRSNSILSLFQDKSGLLWAALQSGISKIEYPSPFTFFNEQNNTPDMVYDFQRFQGKIYTGASDGLHILRNEKDPNKSFFEPVPGDFSVIFEMTPFQEKMIIASKGVFEIDRNEKLNKIIDLTALSLFASKIDSNRLFIGGSPGLTSMYFKDNTWKLDKKFKDINIQVSKILENYNGDLWMDLGRNEVVRISFNDINDAKNLSNPIVKTFTTKDGFPDDHEQLFLIENKIYSTLSREVYLFDPKTERFSKDEKLYKKLGIENKKATINSVDDQGNIWLMQYDEDHRSEQLVAFAQINGTYKLKELNEKRIIDIRKFGTFPELKDSIVWYKGRPGIVRHDLRLKLDKSTQNSKAIITGLVWQNDSLLFGGYKSSIIPQIPFKNNQLRFQFANPSFYDETKNQFQYILEGFDEDWSSWTSESKKDYTNIPGGDYSFKVRSKNIFNQVSSEDSYAFSILPPWYSTWWAYLFYVLGAIALLALYSKWRSNELQKKNVALENTINKRTLEIRQKNELLNHQTEQLVQLNDSKTRLYSNITHEFRTPLTVILGMAETLKTNVLNKSFEGAEKSLEMIRRNGKNLLQLVNEMLDLAKVESGSMALNLVQTDAIPFVKYLSESFHSLAESKKINLTVYSEINALEMDIDVNKMASIISNLLSNAIKFTAANGKIIVHLNTIKTKDSELFSIKVQDNGLGLAEDDIAHLFDRFYQVDNESSQYQEGTGIGLSLAKEFAELMNGTIDVESTLGKGSTFTVQIPVTNNALKTLDAKITVEPPIKKTANSTKTEPSVSDEAFALPLALIIEDNEDVAHYLKTCLKGKYQTMHASDGNMGIEMAFEKIPDIIISDVMMPGKDGFEVCATLKSDERTDHIPIILLTAKVTTEDRLAGLAHGADAYLAKPFNEKELFIRLNQLVLLRKKLIDKIQKDGFNTFLDKQLESPETKFLQKVIHFINEDISNATFGAGDLADKLHLSESQIYRKLKAITDKSTAVFIRSIRLQKAKELIETTDKTISEIAYETGFNDPSWFSRAFKEEFGIAPSDIHK